MSFFASAGGPFKVFGPQKKHIIVYKNFPKGKIQKSGTVRPSGILFYTFSESMTLFK